MSKGRVTSVSQLGGAVTFSSESSLVGKTAVGISSSIDVVVGTKDGPSEVISEVLEFTVGLRVTWVGKSLGRAVTFAPLPLLGKPVGVSPQDEPMVVGTKDGASDGTFEDLESSMLGSLETGVGMK